MNVEVFEEQGSTNMRATSAMLSVDYLVCLCCWPGKGGEEENVRLTYAVSQ